MNILQAKFRGNKICCRRTILHSFHNLNKPTRLLPENKHDNGCHKSYILDMIWLSPEPKGA